MTDGGKTIEQGVVWRVFSAKPDGSGQLQLAAKSEDAVAKIKLVPGNYVVHVAYGRAQASDTLTVKEGENDKSMILEAGGLRLNAAVTGDVPIPTNGQANVLSSSIAFEAKQSMTTTTTQVTYSVVIPKPFCATGPFDFVRLAGPLDFSLTVHTNPSGRYDRSYQLGGTLQVTPMRPTSPTTFEPAGEPVDALIFEAHRGTLTDERGQVTEVGTRVLLGDPQQSLAWRLSAGNPDSFVRQVLCGTE